MYIYNTKSSVAYIRIMIRHTMLILMCIFIIHTHTHTCTHTCTHTRTYTHAPTHQRTRARPHWRAHARTHILITYSIENTSSNCHCKCHSKCQCSNYTYRNLTFKSRPFTAYLFIRRCFSFLCVCAFMRLVLLHYCGCYCHFYFGQPR